MYMPPFKSSDSTRLSDVRAQGCQKSKPSALAIIPARGGSKGLLRKNIRLLCGKPLIAYTIEAALDSTFIDRVIVSTEDVEISEIAKDFGADVPFLRPKRLATDNANVGQATQYTLDRLRQDGYYPDAVITLFPTHPFRTRALIDFLTYKTLAGYHPVKTVKRVRHSEISLFGKTGGGIIFPLLKSITDTEKRQIRSYYRPYGLFSGAFNGASIQPYMHVIKNPISMIDIDILEDFLLAEEVVKQDLFDFSSKEDTDICQTTNRIEEKSVAIEIHTRHSVNCIQPDHASFQISEWKNIAILPIFFHKTENFWLHEDRLAIISNFIWNIKSSEKVDVCYVFTDKTEIIRIAESLGVTVKKSPGPVSDDAEDILPFGAHEAFDQLLSKTDLAFENICVFSFRNPFVTENIIDHAIQTMDHSDAPVLISTKKTEDHPCQLECNYSVTEAGFFYLFENPEVIDTLLRQLEWRHPLDSTISNVKWAIVECGYRVTKPFFFDWRFHGISSTDFPSLYMRTVTDEHIYYSLIEKGMVFRSEEDRPICWVGTSETSARLLIPESLVTRPVGAIGEVYGFSLDEEDHRPVLLVHEDSKHSRYFTISFNASGSHGPWLVRLMAVYEKIPASAGRFEIELDSLQDPIRLPERYADADGIGFVVLKIAEDAGFDLSEPFPSHEQLWFGSEEKINKKTGKAILGRQDFPDTYEPDGTFCIINNKVIRNYKRELIEGRAHGLEIEQRYGCKIRSEFDLLRYRAVNMATSDNEIAIDLSAQADFPDNDREI